jgi:hypothetical protein
MPWRGATGNWIISDLTLADKSVPYNLKPFTEYTPDTPEVNFSYLGGLATATTLQRVKIPASVPQGREMQILGEGFLPGDSVYVEGYSEAPGGVYMEKEVTADAEGKFETSFTIDPAEPTGKAYFYAYGSESELHYTPEHTFQITES